MAYTKNAEIKALLDNVYSVMQAKGYNTINQMTGYLLSGDPTYLTISVRSDVRKYETDELIEELLKVYYDL